jgi:hypothetical protein
MKKDLVGPLGDLDFLAVSLLRQKMKSNYKRRLAEGLRRAEKRYPVTNLEPQISQMCADKSFGSTDSTDFHRLKNRAPIGMEVLVPSMGSMGGALAVPSGERRAGASHDLRPSRRPPSAGPCAGAPKPICVNLCSSVSICGSAFDLGSIKLPQTRPWAGAMSSRRFAGSGY